MLKLLFNRFSKIAMVVEWLGIVFTIGWLKQIAHQPTSLTTKIALGVYIGLYLFMRFCTIKRWHKGVKRYSGIEGHFKRIMVGISYALASVSGIGYSTGSTLLLWPGILVIGALAHVNIILLWLHYQDKTTTPINFFSKNT